MNTLKMGGFSQRLSIRYWKINSNLRSVSVEKVCQLDPLASSMLAFFSNPVMRLRLNHLSSPRIARFDFHVDFTREALARSGY